jgi:predicted DCC family thiol-disulfide oxidoreductase YuxK
MNAWPDDDVILYDGVCIFCSRWIRFIVTQDKAKRFRITQIQSAYGARMARALGIDADDPDTNAVVHGGVAYFKSDGALTVLSSLPGWRWTRVFFVVPKQLRDAVYISSRKTATGSSANTMRASCRMRTCGRGCWNRCPPSLRGA